ncbi:hypothetical protein JCM11251_001855 [Rhodosporidiobolus azoricus]
MSAELAIPTASSSKGAAPPPLWKPASVAPRELPALPTLESLPINQQQCDKAMNALLKHVEKKQEKREEEELLGEQEEKVFLVVGLKTPPKREVHKPMRIPVPHPVLNPRDSPVTLFVKDPQRHYKDLLPELKINFISRVVGLEKLRNKHKTFEAKRQLLKEADLFLVDDRVMVETGKCLGKMWRDAKKQPIPVALQRKDLKAELERAIASTYLNVGTGTSLSIKLGTTSLHTPSELLANLRAVLPYIASRIPNAPQTFSNILSLHLKTTTSTSLPIYNASLASAVEPAELSEGQKKQVEEAKAKKAAEKEERQKKEAEKEKRRLERSATKGGKGRLEKRPLEEAEEGAEEPVEEDGEKVEQAKEETVEQPKKKAKKAAAGEKKAKKSKA